MMKQMNTIKKIFTPYWAKLEMDLLKIHLSIIKGVTPTIITVGVFCKLFMGLKIGIIYLEKTNLYRFIVDKY